MKHTMLITVLLLGWMHLGMLPYPTATQLEGQDEELVQFITEIQGSWVCDVIIEDEGEWLENPPPPLSLNIDPANIRNNEAGIYVSEYCGPGQADLMYFCLKNGSLYFTGASKDGRYEDIERLAFAEIQPIDAGEETLLLYESIEVEYANYIRVRLHRLPEAFW